MFFINDSYIILKKIIAYFYWNFKGVRVVSSSYVSIKAKLHRCSVFGNSVVLDEAIVGKFTYMTDAYVQHATIGDYCSIAPGVKIGLEEHDINNYSTHPSTYDSKGFVKTRGRSQIGNHVWLGANAVILQGVKIGNNSVIGAGAIVTKDVPNNEIWGGIPARFIKNKNI